MSEVPQQDRNTRFRRVALVLAVAAVVVAADQTTKTLAVDHLQNGPVHVIGPFSFELGFNTGVAFSIGTGLSGAIVLLVVVVLAGLLFFARLVPSYPAATFLGLVIGGSFGNLADRLFRGRGGAVVDFIHTSFWPTFNVADACVVIGCFGIAIVFWLRSSHPMPTPDIEEPEDQAS